MKKLSLVCILALACASCHSISDPGASNGGNLPLAGSQFVYRVDGPATSSGSAIQLHETASIVTQTDGMFIVSRTSDTVGSFFTSRTGETYQFLSNNDLWPLTSEPSCDSTALPIATHRPYDTQSPTTPTKKNGVEYDGYVEWHARFDGIENITAAGQTFECSKVEKSVSVSASSGDPSAPKETVTATHIYWYSPLIHFFVKDQIVSNDTVSYTRTLVSYRN